jgi:LuxR family maltose regulon positive regulatory protein
VYMAQNRYSLAAQLIQENDLDIESEINLLYDDILLTQVRLQLFFERLDEAFLVLSRLLAVTEVRAHISRQIEILALQALAFQIKGDLPQALDSLSRALTLAEPGGYVHVFVVEGQPMAHLLYEALSQGIAQNYTQRLLAAFPNIESEKPKPTVSQPSSGDYIEPLSERELDILNLIAEGLTNQEIATRLYLSLNTVKAHTRNIYGKLNVNSRTQAIARSQAFGLLSNKD